MAHKKGEEVGKKKITTTRVVRGGFGRVHFHHFVPGILTWMVMKLIRWNVLGHGGGLGVTEIKGYTLNSYIEASI